MKRIGKALEAGTVLLVGTDKQKIIDEVSLLLENNVHFMLMSKATKPYGDGKACNRITEVLR